MKKHRVREAKPIDGKNEPHIFVEVAPDKWLEIVNNQDIQRRSKASHQVIHSLLEKEKERMG